MPDNDGLTDLLLDIVEVAVLDAGLNSRKTLACPFLLRCHQKSLNSQNDNDHPAIRYCLNSVS